MVRELYYQVLVYRSLIMPFLIASTVAVSIWILFRYFRVRARGQRLSIAREVLLVIFVGYLACVAAATLEPNRSSRLREHDTTGIELQPSLATLTCASGAMTTNSTSRHFCMYNVKGNILLFLPLGFLIPLVWRRMSLWKGIGIALALSVTIEVLQLVSRSWGSYRAVDINDVILNVAGACIGLVLMSIVRSVRGTRPALAHS